MKKNLILFIMLILIIYCPLFPEVVNPDKPLKGDWDLKAEKVWEISGYGKKPMAIPKIGCISDDGTICIYDFKYRLHFVVDSSGKYKTSFGKRGEGPGEVRYPRNYYSVKNKFIIFDQPKLHYFLTDGTFLKSIPIGSRFDPPQLFINENVYISYRERGTAGTFSYVYIKEGNQNIIKKIHPSDGELSESTQGKLITVIIPGLSPRIVTAFDEKNKRLYYGKSDIYLLNICDIKGNIIEKFSLQREKIKFTKKMINRLSGGERRMFRRDYNKLISKFPCLTYFQKIQIEKGLVFVYVIYFGNSWEDQQIDVFSIDGRYLYRTLFKPTKGNKIVNEVFIQNGHLYSILENRDGEQKLVKYKITLPGN